MMIVEGHVHRRSVVLDVAPRKRPVGVERLPRLTIEVHPEDEMLVRRAKSAAVLRGESLRDWFIEAIRQRLEREEGE
jgi:hypothetical protein